MATLPISNQTGSYSARGLCRIVGLACLAGFLFDMIALAIPFVPGALEWRINFFQQVAERSIVLLFGVALILYGNFENRRWLRRVALFSLIAGIVFQLSCILVIRDNLTLQQSAIRNINTQATQLQTQIEKTQKNPAAAPKVTPEQFDKASKLVGNQAESLKQNAKTTTFKAGFASITNLVIVGIALISLGRYGMRLRRG